MKTVYLVRHAKSSWLESNIPDKDRPLKGRGIRDAHASASWFVDTQRLPQELYTSPATRALQTATIFGQAMEFSLRDLHICEELYLCNEFELLSFLRSLPSTVDTVMLFGHNPATTDFVNACQRKRVENVPTTGIVGLEFPGEKWTELEFKAELHLFDYPKRRAED